SRHCWMTHIFELRARCSNTIIPPRVGYVAPGSQLVSLGHQVTFDRGRPNHRCIVVLDRARSSCLSSASIEVDRVGGSRRQGARPKRGQLLGGLRPYPDGPRDWSVPSYAKGVWPYAPLLGDGCRFSLPGLTRMAIVRRTP